MLATSLFDYDLPESFIARYPAPQRDGSRMMVVDRKTGSSEIHPFGDIVEYLTPGDAIVCNNTKVFRGRIFARKAGTPDGAKFEILMLEPNPAEGELVWNVMLKPGKRAKEMVEAVLLTREGELNSANDSFTVLGRNDDNSFRIRFSRDPMILQELYGHIPLPPYLNREDEPEDTERYQTVYASVTGAVAAPTAGLHFTPEILDKARRKGVSVRELTLHVGAGTFKPVSADFAEEHKMHFEEFFLPQETADVLNATHAAKHKVLAVGTTSVRVLESCCDQNGILAPRSGRTDIFMYPPYQPRAVDMLLTNFHLPCSTLLMLVSCFCEREMVLAAYEKAKAEKMRFYSYGDCMLLI